MTAGLPVVVPFRFASLEQLTRADVASAARMRRVARELVDVRAIEAALGELTGARIGIRVGRLRKLDAPRGTDDALGVVVAIAGERSHGAPRAGRGRRRARGGARRARAATEGAAHRRRFARAVRRRSPARSRPCSSRLRVVRMPAWSTKVVAAGPARTSRAICCSPSGDVTTATLTVLRRRRRLRGARERPGRVRADTARAARSRTPRSPRWAMRRSRCRSS